MSAAGPPQGAHCSPRGAAQRRKPKAWGYTSDRRPSRERGSTSVTSASFAAGAAADAHAKGPAA